MAYKLVYYGNDTLKGIAKEILNIDDDVIDMIKSMFKVMYGANGIGLAAPQVDVPDRLIVFDYEDFLADTKVLINPVIKESSDEIIPFDEGCLSLPGLSAEIERPSRILVAGVTPRGKEIEFEAGGLLARVIQHEIDHLNGKVFIDHLEDYQKKELRPELKKIKKLNKK